MEERATLEHSDKETRDCTTEYHKNPTTEAHHMKEADKAEHQESQRKQKESPKIGRRERTHN